MFIVGWADFISTNNLYGIKKEKERGCFNLVL